MAYLVIGATAAGFFLALPWLAVAFNWYCNAVNSLLVKRKRRR